MIRMPLVLAGVGLASHLACAHLCPAPSADSDLGVVDAVFELCVRDVAAAAKFYRDGIGMRQVGDSEPAGAVLEWAGCHLRLRKVPGGKTETVTGNPMQQLLAANGYRWLSLWFRDPLAVAERLVNAGYDRPYEGARASFARDPEGNIVELMGVPRGASGETFTWGMVVSDDAATRRFYRDVLGLTELDPWELPPSIGTRMYQFALGAGRIKFVALPGDRSNDASAGPDAPGLRSVTLRVRDVSAAREHLVKRAAKVEGAERLLLTDPDGNRIYVEQAPARSDLAARTPDGAFSQEGQREEPAEVEKKLESSQRTQAVLERLRARARSVKPTPHEEEVADQRPGEPPLKKMPPGDPSRDAAGRGQLFESIVVTGFTGIQEGMNGVAVADLNKDGLLDIVATYSAPRGSVGIWESGEKLRVFINEGGFKFRTHPIKILDSRVTPDAFGRGQVPVLADFNGDGFLDLFVTRHAQMRAGEPNPRDQKLGNGLYVSDGAWDLFRDVSVQMGIQNEKAYNRQPSIGDVNRDGWLDIAVGCDNIKNAIAGVPHSRLFIFQPEGSKWSNGKFSDIGGSEAVPDFGGFYHDSSKDKAGPDVTLRDLDGDGDLDLVQSFHVDVLDPLSPYSPAEYRQGIFCWKNLHADTGKLEFQKVTDNGLACEARLRYDRERGAYDAVGKAPGLPYVSMADVDNDGLLDILAVGPASPGWAPRAEYVTGRFWRNKGNFVFEEATNSAGLGALNWVYREWCSFFDAPVPTTRPGARIEAGERRPYFADAILGDFDNDGWQDVVVLDRSESDILEARAMLFMNRGNGTFEPKPTTFSGLDGSGICGEAADLNNDGLLDLVFAADPDNSGLATTMARYESKVYWNTGLHGARANHWLRLRFSGVRQAELIGAKVQVLDPSTNRLVGMRVIAADHSYKSGSPLEAHFGLGSLSRVSVVVRLLSGREQRFESVDCDKFLDLDLSESRYRAVGEM